MNNKRKTNLYISKKKLGQNVLFKQIFSSSKIKPFQTKPIKCNFLRRNRNRKVSNINTEKICTSYIT